MKRMMDIVFSLMALVILSPLLLLVTLILRCTGERCVFYRQERVGKGNRPFALYKFVTMREGSDSAPEDLLTATNDPRVLPVGRILRATKINEMPQLFNVLMGDMSLIGPRPQVRPHFDIYPEEVKQEIIKVRPGLSGIGSIVFHDEGNLLTKFDKDHNRCYVEDIAPYKGRLEAWYVQHQSLMLDSLLIFLTVAVVVSRQGGYYLQLLKDLPQPDSVVLWQSLTSA